MSEPTVTCDICGAHLSPKKVIKHMENEHKAHKMVVPDMIGEIIGWRAWRVVYKPKGVHELHSVTNLTVWPVGEWLVAECRVTHYMGGVHHDPPVECCSCGIYAAKTREHLTDMGYHGFQEDNAVVIGEVALAGKVIPGSQGWRASKARPVRIYVPYTRWRLVEPLRKVYGIEVVLDNTLKTAEELSGPEED